METLKQQCLQCENCGLAETRTNVVFGVGNPESPLVFVGEGPGEQEDLQGEPFVGPAGQLLDIMLEIIGLDRSKSYICNIVKCRPPKNRDPYPEEREACKLWLDRQLACLENPMDRGAWWAAVHGITKSGTRLSVHAHQSTYLGPHEA